MTAPAATVPGRDPMPPGRRAMGAAAVRAGAAVAALLALVALGAPRALPGQQPGPEDGVSGLGMAGVRLEPDGSPEDSGFELFTARVGLRGSVAPGIRYHFQAGAGEDLSGVELLDARLEVPLDPAARISVGQFKAPFSEEALREKGRLRFLRRSRAVAALAPGRQVGVELSGEALDRRLSYGTGVFNGEGRTAANPGGGMLWTARVSYNSVGPAAFYDEPVVQVGASAAAASDSATGPGGFTGDRFLLGADAKLTYRDAFLQGEYVRTEFNSEGVGGSGGGSGDVTADGWYAEAGYSVWGALELVARWDRYRAPASEARDFLVLGTSFWTGLESRVAVQLALQADGPPLPRSPAGFGAVPAGGGLADGQVIVRLQAGF